MSFFFLMAFLVFGASYGFVGWRLVVGPGPMNPMVVWGLLLLHFVATFVGFWLVRQVGPTPTTRPLFWFVYGGMGVFSFLFTGFLFAELGWLGLRTVDRIGGTSLMDPERREVLLGAVKWAVLLSAGAGSLWGIRQARRSPDIKEVDVPIEGLPIDLDGYRIAQISDLHVGPTIGAEFAQTVVDSVNDLGPDMIALTGDFVDGSVEHLSEGIAPLSQLRATDGTFFVTGNHEYYSGVRSWCRKMTELGARVLLNQHHRIVRGGSSILLVGVTDYSAARMLPSHASDVDAALEGAPQSDIKVFLAHQPKSHEAAKKHNFDLQLSGHTHGGQFFPWTLVVPWVHRFSRGLYSVGKGWVYVNPGTGYWGPPMRVGVPSEITLLTLRRPTELG